LIPSVTGGHLGVWVEGNDDGTKVMPIGMQEQERWAGSQLARQIQNIGLQGQPPQ
jgi:hypothetical protein